MLPAGLSIHESRRPGRDEACVRVGLRVVCFAGCCQLALSSMVGETRHHLCCAGSRPDMIDRQRLLGQLAHILPHGGCGGGLGFGREPEELACIRGRPNQTPESGYEDRCCMDEFAFSVILTLRSCCAAKLRHPRARRLLPSQGLDETALRARGKNTGRMPSA